MRILGITLALGLLMFVVVETFKHPSMSIELISVPPDLENMGYTGHTMASHLRDKMLELEPGAFSGDIKVEWHRRELDLSMQPANWSVKLVAAYLNKHFRDLLSQWGSRFVNPGITISGDVAFDRAGSYLSLSLRINGRKISDVVSNFFRADQRAVNRLLTEGARNILREIHPVTLAKYYLQRAKFSEFDKLLTPMLATTGARQVQAHYLSGNRHRMISGLYNEIKFALDGHGNLDEAVRAVVNSYHVHAPYEPAAALPSRARTALIGRISAELALHIQPASHGLISTGLDGEMKPNIQDIKHGIDEAVKSSQNEAIRNFRKATILDRKYVEARYLWGLVLLDQGRRNEAVRHFWKIIGYDSEHAMAHYQWGMWLYKVKKDCNSAIRQFRKATNLAPRYADAFYAWGRTLAQLGNIAEAVRQYERTVELNPQYADAYRYWGIALYNMENYAEAGAKFRRLTEFPEKRIEGHHYWGHALESMQDYAGAAEQYRSAIELDPTNADWYAHLGAILVRQGDFPGATELFGKAIELDPKAKWHARLGNALAKMNDFPRAIEHLEKAIEIGPVEAEWYESLGNVLSRVSRLNEADELFEKAKGLPEPRPPVLLNRCEENKPPEETFLDVP